jgi:hypothetical protein
MPSIPVDVLREILQYVGKNDLATLCRVNKIFCSCSRDVLYREICRVRAITTLARSTDLARRVRSFENKFFNSSQELAMVLRNMSSLRSLYLGRIENGPSILDGCTFKLDSLTCSFPYSESLRKFLNSQPSLTNLTIWGEYESLSPFDERCLPNLTCIKALPSWLGVLVPGRPVREVIVIKDLILNIDLSLFTLSTTPIQKLSIDFHMLYPKPGSLIVSIFPSLVHLEVIANGLEWIGHVRLYLSI